MSWLRVFGASLQTELRQMLRDAHVLVFSVGFPLLFYPVLLWGAFQLVLIAQGTAESEPPRVALDGPPDLELALLAPPVVPVPAPESVGTAGAPVGGFVPETVDLWVQAESSAFETRASLVYSSVHPRSQRAHDLLRSRLDELRGEKQAALEVRMGLPSNSLAPFSVHTEDVAPPSDTLAHIASLALPAMAFLSLLVSGIYPAVEVVVGERERGTLETTLVSAAARSPVLAAKGAAVLLVVLLGMAGNLGAVLLTLLHIDGMMGGQAGGISVSWLALAGAMPPVVSSAALATALLILAALPARTFKQGQNLVSTVGTMGMVLVLPGLLPLSSFDLHTALVPITGGVLALRQAVSGEVGLPALLALTTLVNGVAATGVLALAARLTQSERFLFGAPPAWLQRLGVSGGGG